MVKVFVQRGDTLDYVVAGSAITSGTGRLVQEMFGVAHSDGAVGETVAFGVKGVYSLPKDGVAKAFGDRCFWDGTQVVLTAATNNYIGTCAKAAAAGDALVQVNLDSGPIAGGV